MPYYHKIHTDFKLYQCPPPYEILTEYFFILYLIILFEKCCIISNNYVNDEIKALKRKLYLAVLNIFPVVASFLQSNKQLEPLGAAKADETQIQ